MNFTQKNLPIAFDYHGNIPFEVPFETIRPNDIHVYLDLSTRTGKDTCGQNCNHCWFVNYERVHKKDFSIEEGPAIKRALEGQGYKVFARYVDSFAYGGTFMRLYGPAHNREFRQEEDYKPTDTMKKGDAWTSGRPLLANNYVELLDQARLSGYGTISITFHGLLDANLNLLPASKYPILGVFSGAQTEKVLQRIREYNQIRREAYGDLEGFRVNLGVTLGRHNSSRESLIRYAHYFNRLGVNTVRFNCFTDHGGRHPQLQLSNPGVEQAYRDMKWIHDNIELNFQLAVSEDFGTEGVSVMGFPAHVGWCRAGTQLFTVIPSESRTVTASPVVLEEKIGDIVACVNIFEPNLGSLLRKTTSEGTTYSLAFDHAAIADFTQKRLKGVYKNGCFAKDILQEKQIELTREAKRAVSQESRL